MSYIQSNRGITSQCDLVAAAQWHSRVPSDPLSVHESAGLSVQVSQIVAFCIAASLNNTVSNLYTTRLTILVRNMLSMSKAKEVESL